MTIEVFSVNKNLGVNPQLKQTNEIVLQHGAETKGFHMMHCLFLTSDDLDFLARPK